MILKKAGVIGQSGYFESDARRHKTELLLAKSASAGDDLNLLQRLVLSAKQMGQRLFIQTEVEARTYIAQKRRTPLHNQLVSNLLPPAIGDFKPRPITRPKHRIYKFMLNLFGSHVDELPVRQIGYQQVMQKLRPMAICEGLDSLELEGRAAVYESIEEVEFAKTLEPHLDRNFK